MNGALSFLVQFQLSYMTVFAFFMKTLVSPGNFHVLSKFSFRARDLHLFLVQYGCHLELYKGRYVDNLSIQ